MLLQNQVSLAAGQDVQLKELRAANRTLFVVHLLRDALKDLWSHRHPAHAERAWKSRYRHIEPPEPFALNLEPYLPGILAHCRFPLGANLIEGIDSNIKVIKRMA